MKIQVFSLTLKEINGFSIVLSSASFSNLSKIEGKLDKSMKQTTKILKRHRVIVILNFLKDIPDNIDKSKVYYLEYWFMEQQIKYRLDFGMMFQKGNSLYVPLNKIKLFYFFSENQKEVNNFLKAQNVKILKKYLYLFIVRI